MLIGAVLARQSEQARGVAAELAGFDPQHLTTEVRKNKRAGRMFIDTARNAYGQTAAPPYVVRARDGVQRGQRFVRALPACRDVSFDARPGDDIVVAVDALGGYGDEAARAQPAG